MFVFNKKIILLAAIFGFLSCYSVEFQPYQSYLSHKRSDIVCSEIRYRPPDRNFYKLGLLKIHDNALDMQDPYFIDFIKGQICKKGAQGGYITSYRYKKRDSFRTGVYDYRRDYTQTGKITVDQKTLNIVLYNYMDGKPIDCNQQ